MEEVGAPTEVVGGVGRVVVTGASSAVAATVVVVVEVEVDVGTVVVDVDVVVQPMRGCTASRSSWRRG